MNDRVNELRIVNPPFDSKVTDLIINIDYLMREIMICLDREGFLPMKNEI